jgi:hypothetical protein
LIKPKENNMAKELIEDYRLGWDIAHNVGRVALKIVGGDNYRDVPISSNEEFIAIATLLNGRKKVFVEFAQRRFETVDSD